MATPTYVTTGGTSYDTSAPASTISEETHLTNDIMIAVAFNEGGGEMTTESEGWEVLASATEGGDTWKWWWKRAPSASSDDITITSSTVMQISFVFVIRGCITTGNPFEDATTSTGTSNAPSTAEITTTDSDRFVVSSLVVGDNTGWTVFPPPSGWTKDKEYFSSTGTDWRQLGISKEEASATTVSAIQIGTIASSEHWGALTLAFIPESSAGTNTKINIGDVHKDVSEIKINIADVWKDVNKIQINIGDTWKTVFG